MHVGGGGVEAGGDPGRRLCYFLKRRAVLVRHLRLRLSEQTRSEEEEGKERSGRLVRSTAHSPIIRK